MNKMKCHIVKTRVAYLSKPICHMTNESWRHSAKPLLDGLWYDCGMMLFGRVSEGHKILIRTDAIYTDQIPVEGLYEDKPTFP